MFPAVLREGSSNRHQFCTSVSTATASCITDFASVQKAAYGAMMRTLNLRLYLLVHFQYTVSTLGISLLIHAALLGKFCPEFLCNTVSKAGSPLSKYWRQVPVAQRACKEMLSVLSASLFFCLCQHQKGEKLYTGSKTVSHCKHIKLTSTFNKDLTGCK